MRYLIRTHYWWGREEKMTSTRRDSNPWPLCLLLCYHRCSQHQQQYFLIAWDESAVAFRASPESWERKKKDWWKISDIKKWLHWKKKKKKWKTLKLINKVLFKLNLTSAFFCSKMLCFRLVRLKHSGLSIMSKLITKRPYWTLLILQKHASLVFKIM